MENNSNNELTRGICGTMKSIHKSMTIILSKANLEISTQQFFIMKIISEHESVIQQDLAEMMRTDKSAMLRQLNVLQSEMLVARIPDQKDKRKKLLVLTKKGGEVLSKAENKLDKHFNNILVGIDNNELQVFYSVLNKLKENAESIS